MRTAWGGYPWFKIRILNKEKLKTPFYIVIELNNARLKIMEEKDANKTKYFNSYSHARSYAKNHFLKFVNIENEDRCFI